MCNKPVEIYVGIDLRLLWLREAESTVHFLVSRGSGPNSVPKSSTKHLLLALQQRHPHTQI